MSKRVPANLADPALLPTWLPLAIRKYPVKRLLVPGKVSVFVVGFGAASLISILFVPYSTYVKYLKWLTLSLFAYVGVTLFVHVSWGNVARATLIPHVQLTKESLTALAAVLGTTISPYLFFWQASQEVEEVRNNRGEKALKRAPAQAEAQLGRIRLDTYLGVELGRFFHNSDRGVNTLRAWNYADFDVSRGGDCLEASGGQICICALCLRYRGHRTPGRSRFSRFRPPMALEKRAAGT
jgi:hypothetical protein